MAVIPLSKLKIAPSILSADYANLQKDLARIEETSAEYIHLDIMDGHFVPNISFGYELVAALRPFSTKVFDVHLMLSQPERYLEQFAKAGSDIICVHVEVEAEALGLLKKIKALGKQASLAYNPKTSLEGVEQYFPLLRQITLMSVQPGFANQKFITSVLEKGRTLRKKIDASGFDIDIEIDGGVDASNASAIRDAKFTVLVSGSYIFAQDALALPIAALRGRERED